MWNFFSSYRTISDILRQRVESLAQWLEDCISVQKILGSNPIRNAGFFFQATCMLHRSYMNSIFVRWVRVGNEPHES